MLTSSSRLSWADDPSSHPHPRTCTDESEVIRAIVQYDSPCKLARPHPRTSATRAARTSVCASRAYTQRQRCQHPVVLQA